MRTTNNSHKDGWLWNGYDYDRQAWVLEGKYIRCGHPDVMDCDCYGKIHEGQEVREDRPEPGKLYSLTGLGNSIANGNTWAESEVKS